MAVDLPTQDPVGASLLAYEPEKYWAVWQYPEGRYAYSIDESRQAWLISLNSKEAGVAYLLADARMNGRSPAQYRLDELSLPDAFGAARIQPVPFISSQGLEVVRVLGVVLILAGPLEAPAVRHIPL